MLKYVHINTHTHYPQTRRVRGFSPKPGESQPAENGQLNGVLVVGSAISFSLSLILFPTALLYVLAGELLIALTVRDSRIIGRKLPKHEATYSGNHHS